MREFADNSHQGTSPVYYFSVDHRFIRVIVEIPSACLEPSYDAKTLVKTGESPNRSRKKGVGSESTLSNCDLFMNPLFLCPSGNRFAEGPIFHNTGLSSMFFLPAGRQIRLNEPRFQVRVGSEMVQSATYLLHSLIMTFEPFV
jgi:hypothetical protein